MKKILFTTLLCVMNVLFVIAQGTAEITFEKTSYNFGSFSESSPKVTCKFKFKNTGDGPLVIHQCTVVAVCFFGVFVVMCPEIGHINAPCLCKVDSGTKSQ